jgi:hypothetical protein
MSSKPGFRKKAKQWLGDHFSSRKGSKSPNQSLRSSSPAVSFASTPRGQLPALSGTMPGPSALAGPSAQPGSSSATTSPQVNVVAASFPAQAPIATTSAINQESDDSNSVRTIALFRTLLNVSEKVLDGLPIWGPKAAVSAASEVLRAFQVSSS